MINEFVPKTTLLKHPNNKEKALSQKSPEQLFCEIGDTVEFICEAVTDSNEKIKIGDRYTVVDLIGWGWDLERVSGKGATFLRILNSEMKDYVNLYNKS
ncbi:MAG TPA: hypothetical protein VF571_00025 [Pyrinomonadaceae bacterium]